LATLPAEASGRGPGPRPTTRQQPAIRHWVLVACRCTCPNSCNSFSPLTSSNLLFSVSLVCYLKIILFSSVGNVFHLRHSLRVFRSERVNFGIRLRLGNDNLSCYLPASRSTGTGLFNSLKLGNVSFQYLNMYCYLLVTVHNSHVCERFSSVIFKIRSDPHYSLGRNTI